jgi:hypothetical protein
MRLAYGSRKPPDCGGETYEQGAMLAKSPSTATTAGRGPSFPGGTKIQTEGCDSKMTEFRISADETT